MADLLSVRGATRDFGDSQGIFGLDLSVASGEIHALIGLNGAGKSTLMRVILGMLNLEEGYVRIAGVPVDHMPNDAWRGVGHLVERPFAYPDLTTRANLTLAARLHGVTRARIKPVVENALSEFALDRYEKLRTRHLSQGNRQRLGIASAVQHAPALILLDEPTNALDPAGVIQLRELLRQRAAQGAGVLISSHFLDEVARVADRISVLNHGRIIGALRPNGPDLERAFFELIRNDDEL
ncbi:ABC transporter ATP-binding protein [Glutamicibacter sp. X7]